MGSKENLHSYVLDKVPNSDQHISSGSMSWNFTVAHKMLKNIRLHITFSLDLVQCNMNQSLMLGLHIATMRYECHSWHIRNTRNET